MAQRPRHLFSRLFLLALLAIATFGAFWFGLVPQRWSPFSPLSLAEPKQWFLDVRLATMRRDKPLCQATLRSPFIDAVPIGDGPFKNGCGWTNAVRISSVGGARLGTDKLTCETAAGLAMWMTHDVQPLAEEMLGQRVASVSDLGTYSCRNIVGNSFWKDFRSQHATANAIDISGFTLADGRHISLTKDWRGDGKDSRFLKAIKERSCRYFRVSLGPDFNAAHRDHFHFDRGFLWACK